MHDACKHENFLFQFTYIKLEPHCHASEGIVCRYKLWGQTKDLLHFIILSDVGETRENSIWKFLGCQKYVNDAMFIT